MALGGTLENERGVKKRDLEASCSSLASQINTCRDNCEMEDKPAGSKSFSDVFQERMGGLFCVFYSQILICNVN